MIVYWFGLIYFATELLKIAFVKWDYEEISLCIDFGIVDNLKYAQKNETWMKQKVKMHK